MSTTITALIVDDEKPARRRLSRLVKGSSDVKLAAVCPSGAKAIEAIRETSPDLVFLDVQMPSVDGFDVLESIGLDRMPVTIFVTAYDEYALQAFDAHAVDYLLKPYSDERFETALEKALRYVRADRPDDVLDRMEALLNDVHHEENPESKSSASRSHERSNFRPRDRIVLKSKHQAKLLRVSRIVWIEASDVYVKLHTNDQVHLHRERLGTLEEQLDPWTFVRIHRSHIVNIEYVETLVREANGGHAVTLKDGTCLSVSRTYRENLEERLGQSL